MTKEQIIDSFSEYKHSIPVIFSHLEGQYHYEMHESDQGYQILFTNLDYHYVAGDIPKDRTEFVDAIKEYINRYQKKEFVLFAPNRDWEHFMTEIWDDHNGVIDERYSYVLDLQYFNNQSKNYKPQYAANIKMVQDASSTKQYPVAAIVHNDAVISYARGFCIGKKFIEIDVFTDEKYRQKHFAFDTTFQLIRKIIQLGFQPVWTTWKSKTASQKLAEKLCFKPSQKFKAFVWVEDFGDF